MGAPAIVAGGLAAVSAASAYETSKANQKAQEDYNEQLKEDAIRQYQELDDVESDIVYESHAQSLQAQREFMLARSQIENQAAASGTQGNSIDIALADLNSGLDSRMSEIIANRDRELNNVVDTARSIERGVAQSADRTITQPSWLAGMQAGMGTGAAAFSIAQGVKGPATQGRTAVTTPRT